MNPEKHPSVHKSYSCGCRQRETCREVLLKANITHGKSKTPRYQMWNSAKIRAKKHNVPFDLDLSEFPEIPEKCPVLGIPLKGNSQSGPCWNSPTLDRIIPELGYVKGNIKIISHRANTIKSDATEDEILAVARYVHENSQNLVAVVH